MLVGYYLIVNPLVTMAINFGCTPTRLIGSLALARGVTMVDFCLNNGALLPYPINEYLAGSLNMWQITE